MKGIPDYGSLYSYADHLAFEAGEIGDELHDEPEFGPDELHDEPEFGPDGLPVLSESEQAEYEFFKAFGHFA